MSGLRLAAAAMVAVTGLVVAGSAPRAQPAPAGKLRECFRVDQWQGTVAAGPHDLYLRVGFHDVWHIGMAQACWGAQFPGPVRIEDLVTGSEQVCSADDIQIAVAPSGFSHAAPCPISELHRLTPLEASALPKKLQP